jgi:hypothetical protein
MDVRRDEGGRALRDNPPFAIGPQRMGHPPRRQAERRPGAKALLDLEALFVGLKPHANPVLRGLGVVVEEEGFAAG